MSAEDVRDLRAFLDSPAGGAVMKQVRESYQVKPLTERRGGNFWRDSATGDPVSATYRGPGDWLLPPETEAESTGPLDPFRTFPAPPPPARLVSLWPYIIVSICTTACAFLIGWFVAAALKAHP